LAISTITFQLNLELIGWNANMPIFSANETLALKCVGNYLKSTILSTLFALPPKVRGAHLHNVQEFVHFLVLTYKFPKLPHCLLPV
jgi:hypothetical protein